jgi:hypothetical protein
MNCENRSHCQYFCPSHFAYHQLSLALMVPPRFCCSAGRRSASVSLHLISPLTTTTAGCSGFTNIAHSVVPVSSGWLIPRRGAQLVSQSARQCHWDSFLLTFAGLRGAAATDRKAERACVRPHIPTSGTSHKLWLVL